MPLEKVTVAEALYMPHTDCVIWEVEDDKGKRHKLFWKRADFGPSFNINAEIPPKLVMEFNDKMLGKVVNVDIGGAGPLTGVVPNIRDRIREEQDKKKLKAYAKRVKKLGYCIQCQYPWHDGICSCEKTAPADLPDMRDLGYTLEGLK